MALPNSHYYYLVGQLRHLVYWLVPVTPAVVESNLAYVLQLKHLLIALEVPFNIMPKVCLPILILACLVWKEARVCVIDIRKSAALRNNSRQVGRSNFGLK